MTKKQLRSFGETVVELTDLWATEIIAAPGDGETPEDSRDRVSLILDWATEFTATCIHFNGIGDDGHETFYVGRPERSFCKTSRKPYDLAVCMCLLILKDVFGPKFTYSSDGDAPDWQPAVDALNKFAPKAKGVWEFTPAD